MPDRADVEQALAAFVAGTLYPNGTGSDSAVGAVSRVYRGWPVNVALETDLARGAVHVTIQPVSGSMRDRTRYPQDWQGSQPVTTLQASVNGGVIQFSGVGAVGQAVGVMLGGQTYVHRAADGDTPERIAGALAGLIGANWPVQVNGASVTVLGVQGIVARVVCDGQGGQELRRQEAGFRVTLWCPDPTTRDTVAGAIDLAMAGITFLDVLGWGCRVRVSGGTSTDEGAAGGVWRRDLLYSIEYPTATTQALPAMLFGVDDVNGVPFTV